jgi:NAD(P)-dependent dehydrogenase (short-subunit alcohol dehydrogenase family)
MSTVLVTGATDGLGRALATRLAGEGATVLAHARSEERGREALAELLDGPGDVRLVVGDLASLSAVRALADQVPDRLDVLVNNAGIGFGGGREESDDGYELRFAVNYLAGFLLAALLRARLEASAPARIVNVASAGQQAIDFDDVMLEHDYDGGRAYCQSKLAQIMHAFDLAEELAGSGVTATALHPATFMDTKMVRSRVGEPHSTVREGADATVRLAADLSLDVQGRYFDGLEETRPNEIAYDPDARKRLWDVSEQLIASS